jgi:dihydrofolate reductase
MRKLSYFVACSLDGYIATPDGRVDWLFHDGDFGYAEFYEGVDLLLMGRNTYDFVLAGGKWHFPGKKAWVFSTSRRTSPFKEVRFTQGDAVAFVKELKAKKGKKIWLVGGAGLAGPLLPEVDELVVSIHPVTLGDGVPLFPKGEGRTSWSLRSTNSWPNGLVQLTYDRAGL